MNAANLRLIVFLLVMNVSLAQPPVREWVNKYNLSATSQDTPFSVKVDSSGSIMLVGQTTASPGNWGYSVAKLNSTGQVLNSQYRAPQSNFGFYDMTSDASGNTYYTGITNTSAIYDICTRKYNSSGILIWSVNFAGSYGGQDWAKAIAVDDSGNVYVAGHEEVASVNNKDYITIKYNSNGVQQWKVNHGTSAYDEALAVAVDNAGNVYTTGSYGNTSTARTVKYNLNGVQQWAVTVTAPFGGCGGADIATDAAGNVYVGGGGAFINNGQGQAFMAKYNSLGTQQWLTTYAGTNGGDGISAMAVDYLGNVYAAGTTKNSGTNKLNFVTLKYNSAGVQQWVEFYTGIGLNNELYDMVVDDDLNVYVTGISEEGPAGSWTINYCWATIKYCQQGPCVQSPTNRVTGTVFSDTNQNGVQDLGESSINNQLVCSTNGSQIDFGASSATGAYQVYVADTGNCILSAPLLAYDILTTPAPGAVFTGPGQVDSLNHFGIYRIPNVKDLQAFISPYANAVPGFNTLYLLTVKNNGTVTQSGYLRYEYGSQGYITANPAPDTVGSGYLVWNFPNLAVGTFMNVKVEMFTPVSTPLGDTLYHIAHAMPILGDSTPTDNIDTLTQIVVGSYDPNDKAVFPSGDISPAFVANGNYLEYTIRFQNTGTAPAVNVYIVDTLSDKLDVSSLQVLAYSHPYQLEFFGPRHVIFRFGNIMLPDSGVSQSASQGLIRYRIKPYTNLMAGDAIDNTAEINFDFNAPVRTNTVQTNIQNTNSSLPALTAQGFQVFPNPCSGKCVISMPAGKVHHLQIFDVQGQLLKAEVFSGNIHEVDLDRISKGLYILKVNTSVKKILIQ